MSELGAVDRFAAEDRTTAVLASAQPQAEFKAAETRRTHTTAGHILAVGCPSGLEAKRSPSAVQASAASRSYRCASGSVEQRLSHDVALPAFAGFSGYKSLGTLTGSADPDDDFPCGVLLLLHDNEDLDHEDGCTQAGEVYRAGGGLSAAFVEGCVAKGAFAVGVHIERRPFDATERDDVGTAECLSSRPVLPETACGHGVDFTAGLDEVADALERPASDHEVHGWDVRTQSGRSFAVSGKLGRAGIAPQVAAPPSKRCSS